MILCVHRQEEHAVNKQPSPIKQQNFTVRVHEMWSSCFMKLVILRICSFIRATISVLITATNHKLIIAYISILACYSLIFKPCLLLPSKDFDFPKYKAQIQSVKVQNSFRLFLLLNSSVEDKAACIAYCNHRAMFSAHIQHSFLHVYLGVFISCL